MTTSSLQTWQLHEWLDRLHVGELGARDELLRAVSDRLERLARKMLGGFPSLRRWADTGDVLQNALLRLMRALDEVRPDSWRAFFGLAAEQMRRELLDLARRFSRRKEGAVDRAVPLPEGDSQLPSPAVASRDDPGELELWQRFHEAILQLPIEEREVVSLLYYHGWSQPQAAELLQVNERTIRRWWRAACARLHELLGGRFPGLGAEETAEARGRRKSET